MGESAHSSAGAPLAPSPQIVAELRALAIRALPRMYCADEGLFCFRLRREGDADRREGISARYTAIVLIALAGEDERVAGEVIPGSSAEDLCTRLIERVAGSADLGEVALTLWAARALDHPRAAGVLAQLASMAPDRWAYPTVEVSWALTAQVVPGARGKPGGDASGDAALADRIAQRLLLSFDAGSGLFPHWPTGTGASWLRSHVACYADLVYPIQALAYYHRRTGDREALAAARRCAARMCELQGPEGQWWWHYDVRTGRVLERFPVYAVHQDAMGPMALFAARDAGAGDYAEAIARSVAWFEAAPELEESLIDRRSDLIWRKVARREPGKLTRTLQAAVSRAHPAARVPGVDALFRPGRVDYETRPYHMGWVLHAWAGERGSK